MEGEFCGRHWESPISFCVGRQEFTHIIRGDWKIHKDDWKIHKEFG